jgi:membrane protein DedA with SNARE-associated domain
VRRLGLPLLSLLVIGALHHRGRLAGVDYLGVFFAAGASWAAVPGVGEAALIAAGIAAAHGRLDLTLVIAVAWMGASAGGAGGWLIGLKGGRGLLTAGGPLRPLRLALIARGDRFYERYGPVAVLFTPSWMAGIHDMRSSRFIPINTISALVWAAAVGGGAYLIGPPIADVAADVGLLGGAFVLALFVVFLGAVVVRRGRRARRLGGNVG